MKESKQRKIGAFLSYVSIIVNTLVQLLYTPILIRKLGQSEYGLYSLVNSIIGYLTVLDLGFGNAIIVYTSKYRAQEKYEDEKKLHGMFFTIFSIISVIAGIIGLILYFNVDNLFEAKMTVEELSKMKIMMLILTFNLSFTFIFSMFSSILTAYERFTYRKITSIVSTLLKPLIMLPLLFLGFKSITLALVITFVNVIILLSNFLYCKFKLNIKLKFGGFDKKVFKEIFGYSFFIFLGELVDKANWSVDNFVLGSVSGTIAVSVYSVAAHLNKTFINLSSAISGVMLPKMSKMIAKQASSEMITNEFVKVGRIQFFIVFLMLSGFVLFGKEFINLWAGVGYTNAYYVALILIIPLSVPLIQNLGISIRQAMNKHKFAAIVNVIVAIFNVAVSIPLAIKYGEIGAAIGTGVGVLLSSLIINIYYHKIIKINVIIFWINIGKLVCYSLVPLIFIIVFMNLVKLSGIEAFIIYGSLYTSVFLVFSYLVSMNSYEKEQVHNVYNKIFRRKKVGINN